MVRSRLESKRSRMQVQRSQDVDPGGIVNNQDQSNQQISSPPATRTRSSSQRKRKKVDNDADVEDALEDRQSVSGKEQENPSTNDQLNSNTTRDNDDNSKNKSVPTRRTKKASLARNTNPAEPIRENETDVQEARNTEQNPEINNDNETPIRRSNFREAQARVARDRAAHFALADGANSSNRRSPSNRRTDNQNEEWCGPFATARRLIEARAEVAAERQRRLNGDINDENKEDNADDSKVVIEWAGKGQGSLHGRVFRVPKLFDQCVELISCHFDCVEDLGEVTAEVRNKLARLLCRQLRLTQDVLSRIFPVGVTEIVLPDCSRIDAGEMLETLLRCLEFLTVLELRMCGRCFTDDTVSSIAKAGGFPNMTHMVLSGTYMLSDVVLDSLIRCCPKLIHLEMPQNSRLGKVGLEIISKNLSHQLETLSIAMCESLSSVDLELISALPLLKSLDLSGLPNLNDYVVEKIVSSCGYGLRSLKLDDCSELSDAALQAISSHCGAELTELSLSTLPLLTGESLAIYFEIASNSREKNEGHALSGLKKLCLRSSARGGIGDDVVVHIAKSCAGTMTVLDLVSSEISDAGISALTMHCSSCIKELDLSFCRRLSNAALGYLVDASKQLDILTLWGNLQIDDEFLKKHSNTELLVIKV